MVRRLSRFFVLGMIGAMLFGCASAKLKLDLAIYKEDPLRVEIVTANDIGKAQENIKGLSGTIEGIARFRTDLAQGMFNVYGKYRLVAGQLRASNYTEADLASDLSILKSYLDEFKRYMEDTQVLCNTNLQTTLGWLKKYGELLPATLGDTGTSATTETMIRKNRVLKATRQAMNDLQRSLSSLSGPSDTKFEKTLQSLWPKTFARIESDQLKIWMDKSGNKAVLDELCTKAGQVEKTLAEARKIHLVVNKDLDNIMESLKQFDSPEQLVKAGNALAKEDMLNIRPGDNSYIEQAKRFDLWSSQIERLQDPADPVWRIVTDEQNKEKWNKKFSRTFFRAEGNTSVVVVRDSPMEFRVQQGSNNPAALVQAQLQVSRAIADAAITVVGATTGVNLAALPKPGDKSTGTDEAQIKESDDLARRKAKVARAGEQRDLAIRRLSSNLRSLKEQIELTDDEQKIKRLLDVLIATLTADETVFKNKNNDK